VVVLVELEERRGNPLQVHLVAGALWVLRLVSVSVVLCENAEEFNTSTFSSLIAVGSVAKSVPLALNWPLLADG
jgi:hypothetical protein